MSAQQIPGPTDQVVIVGAGLSGLTAGLYLRSAGHRVTIIERNAHAGGLVRTERLSATDGVEHHFDTGATILTMPELVVGALGAVGVSSDEAARRLGLRTVDPSYAMRFADGSGLDVRHDRAALINEVDTRFGAKQARGVANLCDWLDRLYDVEFDAFIDRNFDGIGDFVDPQLRGPALQLARLGAIRGLTGAIARHVSDERLQRAFTFQALYAGVPPHRAAAIYAIIAQMDIGRGVYYPAGGMGTVGRVLADAFVDAGGVLEFATRATSFHRSASGRIDVVEAIGPNETPTDFPADAVIAAVGVPVIDSLLTPANREIRAIRYSPSAVVAHGIMPTSSTRSWPGDHHTIDFGAAWKSTFAQISPGRRRRGQLMSDPSLLLTRPAISDPDTFRRNGFESVSLLAPCPNLDAAPLEWSALARPYVTECLGVLERRGYRGIAQMEILRIDDPSSWADAGYGAGTPFSAAHTVRQTGPFRTPNRWPGVENLVVAGAATTPGVGIPPVLISGRLAADRITSTRQDGVAR
ncbi:phytoene dehydrogenase [Gordonia effusa NBRC 100432]|uniref:Phytoene dehydrogenase n=1 Tax=Gordonia effusa NBRC 100432 TaxID=1077974 RepID=H0R2P8_9ACTN|nr:phytoene desaturase family protein [Gordonia effusa]GAB19349.1 phytoene dehydrogenase [Gordonia effusa NBRC 100432]